MVGHVPLVSAGQISHPACAIPVPDGMIIQAARTLRPCGQLARWSLARWSTALGTLRHRAHGGTGACCSTGHVELGRVPAAIHAGNTTALPRVVTCDGANAASHKKHAPGRFA